MKMNLEACGDNVALGWAQGRSHKVFEDRFRMLTNHVKLVKTSGRGELLAVFDGVGSAAMGVRAAQAMADALLAFYPHNATGSAVPQSLPLNAAERATESMGELSNILHRNSAIIQQWGNMEGTDRPLGAAAGSLVWIPPDNPSSVHVLHAGDTQVLLFCDTGVVRALTTVDQGPDGALNNYFGSPHLNLHYETAPFAPGDRLVLTSDGVSKIMSHQQLAALSAASVDLKAFCASVVTKCQLSTADDITVLVYEYE